jgi:hypothetical protein
MSAIRPSAPTGAASPPDVRRGYAPPVATSISLELCPWFGLSPSCAGRARTRGIAQLLLMFPPAGHSPASHPAAKPRRRVLTNDFSDRTHPAAKPRRRVFTSDFSDRTQPAAKPLRTVFITSQLGDWHIRQQCRTRRVRY